MRKIAPLSGGFFIAGIVILFVSLFKIWAWNKTWGFAMIIFSIILIVSSLVSMTYADEKSILAMDHIRMNKKLEKPEKKPKKTLKKRKSKKK